MFSSEIIRCSKHIFMNISFAVLIGLAGQNLLAQTSSEEAQGIVVEYGTATPGIRHELPSNQELGVDINRFIGNPARSHPYLSHDAIIMRSILRHGDPHRPGRAGSHIGIPEGACRGRAAARRPDPAGRAPRPDVPVHRKRAGTFRQRPGILGFAGGNCRPDSAPCPTPFCSTTRTSR